MSLLFPGHLKSVLSEYVARLDGVRLIRNTKRLGVAGCRSLGAARAAGEVLVFMDSHCECQTGWLEPLLERVAQDRYTSPHVIKSFVQEKQQAAAAESRQTSR